MTGHVNDIFQDSTGYIWFCSGDGAFRFNGYNFQHFNHDPNDSSTISSNEIKCGFVDAKGRIWFGTNQGLELYDAEKDVFTCFRDTMSWNRLVLDIEQAENGKLWLGTWEGLVLFDPETGNVQKHYFTRNEPENVSGFHATRTVYKDSRQRLWLCTWNGGLRVFDTKTLEYVAWYKHEPENPGSLASNDIRDVLEDEKGNIWVAVWDGGLHLLDQDTGTFKKFIFFPERDHRSYNQINNLHVDSQGNFWVTTQKGLILFDRNSFDYQFFEQNSRLYHGYKGTVSNEIFEDNHQGIWIAASQIPVNYFNLKSLKFNTYQYETFQGNSPSGTTVRNIESHPNGMIYISYLNEIDRFNPETSQFEQIEFEPVKPGANLGDMAIDKSGYLWLSADNLYHFNPNTGKSIYFTPEDLQKQEINPKVKRMKVDGRNNLWLKYKSEIIFKPADNNSFVVFSFEKKISDFFVAGNSLWYTDGTLKELEIQDSSIYFLQDTVLEVENHPGIQLKNHRLNGSILQHEDSGNIFLVDRGLQQLTIYNPQSGNSSNHSIPFNDKRVDVSCFLKENEQLKFWMGTNTGLFSYDISNNELLNFTSTDGLLETRISGQAFAKQNNRMFFAGPHTFLALNPKRYVKTTTKHLLYSVRLKCLIKILKISQHSR